MIKKYLKLQSDIMKAAVKYASTGREKDFDYYWDYEVDGVYIAIHGVVVLKVPKDCWYLDINKAFKNPRSERYVCLTPWADRANKQLIDTNEIITHGKTKIHKYYLDNNAKKNVYINEELLKWFDLNTCKLMGAKPHTPVFVIDANGERHGMIMPIRMPIKKEGGESK